MIDNAYHDDYREDRVRDDWKTTIHVMVHLVVLIFPVHVVIIPVLVKVHLHLVLVTILFVAALVIMFLHFTHILLVDNVIVTIYFIHEVSRLHVFLIKVNILLQSFPALQTD